MKTIGLTGNIGSGKSYVAAILEKMGYPVYYADKEAQRLMQSPEVIMHLIDRFGMDILAPDGLPNRRKIAALVFSNPEALNWINHLVHPLVIQDWLQWLQKHAGAPCCFMESAILFEHGLDKHFDAVIVVDVPPEVAIQRVMERDGLSREQVLDRMNRQMPSAEKRGKAGIVIDNDGNTLLMPQILKALESCSC
jgi:dephospho-CoA kinase